MPVNSPHPQYVQYLPKWQRARDVIDGEDAVKAGDAKYLPAIDGKGGQSNDDYKNYKLRAHFFNATSRTAEAFHGLIYRKNPTEEMPDSLAQFVTDCTMTGESWYEFAKTTVRDVIDVGRSGTLIDFGNGPYVTRYRAEDILNWRTQKIGGRMMLTLVVLQEEYQDDAGDEYETERETQLRVLKLLPNAQGMQVYTVEIWREVKADNDKTEWEMTESMVPTRRGKPLDEIPFVFHGSRSCGVDCGKPPLDDIILTNLSHYRSSADLEHGRHYVALPTPWITGVNDEVQLRVGPATAWTIENEQAKVGMLEFHGNGLQALEKALEQKEHHMAVLGAKLLEAPKRAAEAFETVQLKQSGEGASLSNLANTMSESLGKVLAWAAWWNAAADTALRDVLAICSYTLNTDFTSQQMSAQMLTALVAALQGGMMSKRSFTWNLHQGEMLDPSLTIEDEMSLVDGQMPPGTLKVDKTENADDAGGGGAASGGD